MIRIKDWKFAPDIVEIVETGLTCPYSAKSFGTLTMIGHTFRGDQFTAQVKDDMPNRKVYIRSITGTLIYQNEEVTTVTELFELASMYPRGKYVWEIRIEPFAVCSVCGKPIDFSKAYYRGEYGYACSSECFHENFWEEKKVWRDNGDITEERAVVIRCGGKHYLLYPKGANDQCSGFGGREFSFYVQNGPHAGKVITSTNVWCQGEIPAEVDLPDNAIVCNRLKAAIAGIPVYKVVPPDAYGEEYLEEINAKKK